MLLLQPKRSGTMPKGFIPIIYLTFNGSVCLFVCVKRFVFKKLMERKDNKNEKWKTGIKLTIYSHVSLHWNAKYLWHLDSCLLCVAKGVDEALSFSETAPAFIGDSQAYQLFAAGSLPEDELWFRPHLLVPWPGHSCHMESWRCWPPCYDLSCLFGEVGLEQPVLTWAGASSVCFFYSMIPMHHLLIQNMHLDSP